MAALNNPVCGFRVQEKFSKVDFEVWEAEQREQADNDMKQMKEQAAAEVDLGASRYGNFFCVLDPAASPLLNMV